MSAKFAVFMVHVMLLQVIVLALRIASSYQAIDLGFGALGVGLVAASFALLPLALAVPLGRLIDVRGAHWSLAAGTVVLLVAVGAFNFAAASVPGLVICTILLGCAHFLSMVGQHSYVATNVAARIRDNQFGWYAAAISFGQMLGPGAIAVVSNGTQPDLAMAYWLCVPFVVAQLATLAVLLPRGKRARPAGNESHASIGQLLRIRGIWLAILAGVAVMAGMDLLTIYLPLLGNERDMDASVIAALMTVRAAFTLVSRLSYGFLVQRLSRSLLLSMTIGAAGLACAALVMPLPLPLMFAAIAFFGFGLGAALPITLTWISQIAPTEDRGTVFSLRQSVLRASQVAIPVLGGGLAAVLGVSSIFLVLALFLCATALASRQAD